MHEDDIKPPGRGYGAYAIGALGLLVFLAVVPKLLGLDWFALRAITSKTIYVHVLNTSGQDLEVSVSHGSTETVTAGTMALIQTMSGDVSISARGLDGELLEELEVRLDDDTLYNALGSECLAVLDVSSFYGADNIPFSVVDRIRREDRLYTFTAGTVLLPRGTPPDSAAPPVHWIETFGCELLDDEEEGYLLTQAQVRLNARWEAYQEARREHYGGN